MQRLEVSGAVRPIYGSLGVGRLILYVSTTLFITQGNYVCYMFRLLKSHLQAYSLQVKSQDAVHTLGSQCVYISEILKPCHLPRTVKRAKCVANWLKYI